MNKLNEIYTYFSNQNEKIKNTSDILKILHDNNIEYTENFNGIFLNLSLLNDNIINDIYYLIKSNESTEHINHTTNNNETTKIENFYNLMREAFKNKLNELIYYENRIVGFHMSVLSHLIPPN